MGLEPQAGWESFRRAVSSCWLVSKVCFFSRLRLPIHYISVVSGHPGCVHVCFWNRELLWSSGQEEKTYCSLQPLATARLWNCLHLQSGQARTRPTAFGFGTDTSSVLLVHCKIYRTITDTLRRGQWTLNIKCQKNPKPKKIPQSILNYRQVKKNLKCINSILSHMGRRLSS